MSEPASPPPESDTSWLHMKEPLSMPDILGRTRTLLVGGVALTLMLVAGLLGYELSLRQGMASVRTDAGHRLELFAAAAESMLNRLEHVPATIQLNPEVVGLMADQADPARRSAVNRYLKQLNGHLGSTAAYVLNERGIVLASSNSGEPGSFVGEDLSFRPYFIEALSGRMGHHFAIGNTSGVPGYYLSSPVRDGNRVVGVAVIKIPLTAIEQAWSLLGVPALIADENQVVILSSLPDWQYNTLIDQPLDKRVELQINQLYNLKNLPRFALSARLSGQDQEALSKGLVVNGSGMPTHVGNDLLVQGLHIQKMNWQLLVFSNLATVRKQAMLVSLLSCATAAFVSLLWLVVNQRRRIITQKLAAKRMLERANAQLEQKVARRTQALSNTNDLLRQEVKERIQAEQTLRAAQDELVQAAKLAVLGQLSTGITHELAQPLGAIRTLSGNTSEFLKRGDLDTVGSNLALINRLADQMGGILQPLKGFARKSPSIPASTDIAQAAHNALLLFASRLRSEGITLVNHCQEGHTLAWCDPNRLEQVIINLVGNALDAMRDAPEKVLTLAAQGTDDGHVRLTVTDTGSGVPAEMLDRLFEPFFTTKPVGIGLGLGLSISRDIVRDFHGELSAHNLPEGGACFTVTLPEKRLDGLPIGPMPLGHTSSLPHSPTLPTS